MTHRSPFDVFREVAKSVPTAKILPAGPQEKGPKIDHLVEVADEIQEY